MTPSQLTNFVKVIKECQGSSGTGKKRAIQNALGQADEHTRTLVWYALNPYLTYGIRKWEKPTKYGEPGQAGIDRFLDLLNALAARELTGNMAAKAVSETLQLYTEEEAEFLSLVIEKDLRAGFSEDTANKAWQKLPNYKPIPTFEVMLAQKCDTPEEFEERVKFPALAEHKYDGERTIAVVKKHDIEYFSRSGKPRVHLNGLFDLDLFKLRDLLEYDYVLDGEVVGQSFKETVNAKKEGNDKAKSSLVYRTFFLMPLSDWLNQKTKITMEHNRFFLEHALKQIEAVKLIMPVGREVQSYSDMISYCNEAIDTYKQEGLIIKSWKSTYVWDRDYAWVKVKRFYDVDARVVGWYKGRTGTRLEDTCGGIIVEGHDEQGRPFRCSVGSGFSDEDRADIAANFNEKYLGSTAVVTYQEMSLAEGETIYSLRFPTIKQLLRDDKVVPRLSG